MNDFARRKPARFMVLASLQMLLTPFLPAYAQMAPTQDYSTGSAMPAGRQLEGLTAVRSVQVARPTTNQAQVIQGDTLTSGQLTQILSSGPRTFILQSSNPIPGDVMIPRGITLINTVSSNSSVLNVQGNLVDAGRLLFRAADTSVLQASLNANNITVSPGGLIAALNGLSLNISATGNIINAGTISSANNLNLTAGGSIINALPQGYTGVQPVIQAMQNINLLTGTGNITNSGLINAGANVNIAAVTASQSLNLSNVLGTIQAGSAINFRDASYTGTGNIDIRGGNLISQVLNLNSGKGTVDVFVNDISGTVNATACNAHIGAFKSDNLILGNLNVSGDPTYFNTGGDVTINSNISTNGADLAILASENVIIDNNAVIDTGSLTADSGDLLIVAGGELSGAAPGQVDNDNATPITITNGPGPGGGSFSGGNIDMTASGGIATAAKAAGFEGGSVQLIAYSGNVFQTGKVNIGTPIDSSSIDDKAGDITIIAGLPFNDGINVGTITSTGTDGSGSVTMFTADPTITGGNIIVTDGTATGGSFVATNLHPSNIVTNAITTNSFIQLVSGNNITVNSSLTSNGNPIAVLAGRNVSLTDVSTTGTGAGANVFVAAGAEISVSSSIAQLNNGPGSGGGGILGGDINFTTAGNSIDTSASGVDNNAGNITLIAYDGTNQGGDIFIPTPVLASGTDNGKNGVVYLLGAGNSGAITVDDIDVSGSTSITTASGAIFITAATAIINGGTITVSGGTTGGTGIFNANSFQATPTIYTTGNLTSNSGGIQLASGGGIIIGGDITTNSKVFELSSGPIALLAQDGINTDVGGTPFTIQTGSNAAFGAGIKGTISIVAGAQLLAGATSSQVIVNGASTTGGDIRLDTINGGTLGAGAFLQAEGACCGGTNSTERGGTVTLIAFGDSANSHGQVNLLTGTIAVSTDTGASIRNSGTINIIAGGGGPNAVISGDLVTAFGAAGTGAVNIDAAQPTVPVGGINYSSGIAGGSYTAGAQNNGVISLESINAANSISIKAGSNVNITGSLTVVANGNTGTSITISAPITLNAEGGAGGAISTGSASIAGTINVTAGQIVVNGTGPLLLSADGNGSSNGGTINVTQTQNTDLNIGTQPTGNNIQVSAVSGASGGDGGTINFKSALNLIVDPAAISAAPSPAGDGNGAKYNLTAGTTSSGNLQITGPLNADGSNKGSGGSITLTSNINAAFLVGGVGIFNYLDGTASANAGATGNGAGGSVTITNADIGGIDLSDPTVISVSPQGTGNGGSIDIEAPTGPLTMGNGILSADTFGGTGGLVKLVGASLSLPTTGAGFDVSANTGSVVVQSGSASSTTINTVNSFAGQDVALLAPNSGYSLGANTVNGSNSVALITKNSITASSVSGIAPTQTLVLVSTGGDVGTSASRLVVDAPNITAQALSGNVFIRNTSTGDGLGNVNIVNSTVDGTPYKNAASSTYSVIVDGISPFKDLTTNAGVNIAANKIDLTSSGGFGLAGNLTGIASVGLISNDSILTGAIGLVGTQSLVLAATGVGSNIGSSPFTRLSIDVENVTAQAANGSVFIDDASVGGGSSNVNLVDATVNGTAYTNKAQNSYSFLASKVTNSLTSKANVSASDVVLTSSNNIDLTGATVSGSNQVGYISTGMTGTILSVGNTSTQTLTVAANADVGSAGARLSVNAPNLLVRSSSGNVFVTNTSTGDVNGDVYLTNTTVEFPRTNSAFGTYSVIASGVASGKSFRSMFGNDVNGLNIDLTSSGGVNFNGNITAPNSIAVIANDAILNGTFVSNGHVLLASQNDIGSSGSKLLINGRDLTLSSAFGSVFVKNQYSAGDIHLINKTVNGVDYTNSAFTTYSLDCPNMFSLDKLVTFGGDTISAQNIDITTAGGIQLGGTVTGSKSVALIAGAPLTSLNGLAPTPSLTLVSINSIGTDATNRLFVSAENLTAKGSSVFITNTSSGDINGNVNLVNSNVNGTPYTNTGGIGFYSVKATGIASGKNLTNSTGISTGLELVLSSSGGVLMSGTLTATAPGGTVAIISNDPISSTSISTLSATNVVLATKGLSSDIGSSSQRLLLNNQNITAQATGSVFVTDQFANTISISDRGVEGTVYQNSANATYSFQATSLSAGQSLAVSIGSNIVANNIALTTSQNFIFNLNTLQGASSVALISNGDILAVPALSTPHLILATTGAGTSIGTSGIARLDVSVPNLTAQATDSAFIKNSSSGTDITLLDATVDGVTYKNTAGNKYSLLAPFILGESIKTGSTTDVSADFVELLSGGGLDIQGKVTGATSVALVCTNSILTLGNVSAPNLTLAVKAPNATLGSSSSSRLSVDAQNLTLSANQGSVFVANTAKSGTIGLVDSIVDGNAYFNEASSTVGIYDLFASNGASIDMGSSQVKGRDVLLASSAGGVTVKGINLTANNINLSSPLGALTISDNTLVAAFFASGGAGSIILSADSIVGAGGPLSLTAKADPGQFSNGGTISVTSVKSMALGTGNGEISINVDAGQNAGSNGNGGTVSAFVTGANTLSFTSTALKTLAGPDGGNGANIVLSSQGTVDFPSISSINADGTGLANGGQIFITGDKITFGGTLAISANGGGGGSGNGGIIEINSNNASSNLNIGTKTGNVSFAATSGSLGGNGGFVTVISGGDLTFDSAGVVADPNAAGNGNGAYVSMTAFNTLTLSNTSYTYNGAGNGDGGALHLEGSTIVPSGATTLSARSSVTGTGNGGSIEYIVSTGDITVDAAGLTVIANGGSAASSGGNGGSVNITTSGKLAVNPTALQVGPLGKNGNGGILVLQGNVVTAVAPGTRLDLSANGGGLDFTGTGNGGAMTISQAGAPLLTIGTATTNNYSLSASAGLGGGSGGSITFNTDGSLTVDPLGIKVLAQSPSGQLASGGSLTIGAGLGSAGGTLLVTGNLDMSSVGTNPSSVGGNIALLSNSKTAFSIKTGSTNGTKGTLSVTGNGGDGQISISNLGGSVTDGQAAMNASSIGFNTGKDGAILINGTLTAGEVSLSANGKGGITASKTIQSASISASSGTGNISLSNIDVSIATAVSANTGGTVTLTGKVASFQIPTALSVGASSGKTVTIKTLDNLIITGAINGGSIALETTNGNVNINSALVSTGTISVKGAGITMSGSTNSSGNTTFAAKLAGIDLSPTALLTAGALVGSPPPATTPLLTADISKAGSITLTSTAAGSNALKIQGGASVTANGGSITLKTTGTTADVTVGDNAAVIANGGAVAIISTGKTTVASTTTQTIMARSLNGGKGTVSITATGGIVLTDASNISANKNITLTSSNAASEFQVGNNATISAGFGGGTASGTLAITANGTGTDAFKSGLGSDYSATGGTLKISSKGGLQTDTGNTFTSKGGMTLSAAGSNGFLKIDDGSDITNVGGAMTIKGAGGVRLGANGVSGSGTIVSNSGSSSSSITISGDGVTLGPSSQVNSTAKLTLTSTPGKLGGLAIAAGNQLTGSAISISSVLSIGIGDGAKMTATAASGGNITITATNATSGGVGIGDNYDFRTTGNGNISITAKGDQLTIGKVGGSKASIMQTKGATGTIKLSSPNLLSIGAGTLDTSNGSAVTISSSKSQVKLEGTVLSVKSTATITGTLGVILSAANVGTTGNLNITSTGTSDISITDGTTLSAGTLSGPTPTKALSPTQVLTKGSIILTAAKGVTVGIDNKWTSNGGDIKVIAKTGNIQVGSNSAITKNAITAYGGNVQFLAKGTVSGDKNDFTAFGMGSASPLSNTGGGIELGSGLISSSAINAALGLKGTLPINNNVSAITGTPPFVINNTVGVIQVNNKSGASTPIDLSGSTLNLNIVGAQGGAQVFDAATTGSTVTMKNSTFTTSAFKPIAMTTVEGAVVLPPVAQAKRSKGESQIFAGPRTKLMESGSTGVRLIDGELFVSATTPIEVNTEHADVIAQKGALVAVRQFQGNTYVRACSPLGTVRVKVGSKLVELNPGEEMMVADHKPDASEVHLEDGLGRRRSHTVVHGTKHLTISDFAIITMISRSDSLAELIKSKDADDRHLVARLLKTAASIDVALRHRGAYASK